MKNNKYNIKFETIEYVMGWVYLKNKSEYLKWLEKKNYINNNTLKKITQKMNQLNLKNTLINTK